MQVTETKNEGLKREYNVKLDATSINAQIESELQSMAGKVKISGFRPGRVPMTVLKQRFGKSVLGDVIERSVAQSSQKVLKDKSLRASMQPKVEITSYEEGGDLDFHMAVEVMPTIPEIDFSKIELEKMVADIDEKEVEEAITRLADRNKTYTRAAKGAKAASGDQLVMDFVGKVGGEEFEGGAAKKFKLVLGSGQFIDGFEDQLIGAKEGDHVTVKVTFPKAYHKEDLAGQPAEFAVDVHEIKTGEVTSADDAFAAKLGFTDLEAMRKAVREQFTGDYENAARSRMKKELFDKLETSCEFEIPKGMMDLEFSGIWEKLQQAKKDGDEGIAGKSDDELREEYTKIAQRRVKLGILLSEVAVKNKIQVNQDELSRAVMQQAQQYPGQERRIFEFYQQHPHQLEELRGPILEEKAVDFILGKAKVKELKVTMEELMKEDDEASAPAAEEKKKSPPKKKKAANE
jgi:trigger factor